MHAGSIQNLVPHAKRAGLIATCLAAAAAAQFGWSQGSGYIGKAVTLAGFCVLASFVVGYAPAFAACAYRQGARAVGHACIALFVVGVLVEAVGAFGFNAAARFAGVETAQHQQTVYTDTRSELERARTDLASMKPTRTPAAISAEMQGIESRPWFASTASCSSPGSYGNSCRRYIALKGELATAQARAALDTRVQKLASEASTREIGQSDVGSQSRVIASVATFQVKPSAEQEYWTFVSVSALFTLFMVLSGLINFAAYGIDPEAEAKPAAAIVPFKSPAHPVGSAHVGPTSGPMIPASLKVANG
jgi:hypothetical protein